MYKAIVNGKAFEIVPDQENWLVNGNPLAWDVTSLGDGHYHIIYKNKGYRAELVKMDREAKTVDLKINGVNCAHTTYPQS